MSTVSHLSKLDIQNFYFRNLQNQFPETCLFYTGKCCSKVQTKVSNSKREVIVITLNECTFFQTVLYCRTCACESSRMY